MSTLKTKTLSNPDVKVMTKPESYDIEKIMKLARLELSDDQKESIDKRLQAVLEYVAQIESINTDNVTPTFHPVDVSDVLRKDEVTKSIDHEKVFKNAPKSAQQHFAVPKVLEQ